MSLSTMIFKRGRGESLQSEVELELLKKGVGFGKQSIVDERPAAGRRNKSRRMVPRAGMSKSVPPAPSAASTAPVGMSKARGFGRRQE